MALPTWGSSTVFGSSAKPGHERGFVLVDVESGAGDLPGPQRRDERDLVDDRPAGRVDEDRGRFHRAQHLGVDQVPGRFGERDVHGQEVAARHQVRPAAVFDAAGELAEVGVVDVAVAGWAGAEQHPHAEPERAPGGCARDTPEPGQTQSLSAHVVPEQ